MTTSTSTTNTTGAAGEHVRDPEQAPVVGWLRIACLGLGALSGVKTAQTLAWVYGVLFCLPFLVAAWRLRGRRSWPPVALGLLALLHVVASVLFLAANGLGAAWYDDLVTAGGLPFSLAVVGLTSALVTRRRRA